MKNILVPTDFSVYAKYAFNLAIQLSISEKCKLHIFHSADLPEPWLSLPEDERRKDAVNSQKAHNINVLLDELKSLCKEHKIDYRTVVAGKNLVEQLKLYVAQEQIDLLVMGSHGVSGKQEYFIGSNTQKVIRTIHRPVLIIKEELKELSFKKVVFASGFEAREQESFRRFLNFVKNYNPEVHLLAINTSSFFSQPSMILYDAMDDFKELTKPLICKKHFYNDISVEAGIRHFAESIDADLIAISYRFRHPIKRMFQGSNVELLINHSRVPVLTIDYVDNNRK